MPATKMSSFDRVIVLEAIEGKHKLATSGLVDNRVLTGENSVHIVRDNQTCNWYIRYDQGIMPQPLRGMFTSFPKALKHAENYFQKRNMKIKEIRD
jgi:hypothetical protein